MRAAINRLVEGVVGRQDSVDDLALPFNCVIAVQLDHRLASRNGFRSIDLNLIIVLRPNTAAADAVGYTATGLELDREYFRLAETAIPRLAALYPEFKGQAIDLELSGSVERDERQDQLALVLGGIP